MAEELFSGFDGQKILAERANKDINGNSLELTISDNKVTAIGGKTVGGGTCHSNTIHWNGLIDLKKTYIKLNSQTLWGAER